MSVTGTSVIAIRRGAKAGRYGIETAAAPDICASATFGSKAPFWSLANYFHLPLETDIVTAGRHVSKGAGTRHRLDRLTTGLRGFMLYGCLTRLKQHPHAPDEKHDACYPCNQTA